MGGEIGVCSYDMALLAFRITVKSLRTEKSAILCSCSDCFPQHAIYKWKHTAHAGPFEPFEVGVGGWRPIGRRSGHKWYLQIVLLT